MKLSQIFAEKRPTLSFEVFPPKTSDTYDSVKFAAEKIASLKPDFMSVTYGAGGGPSKYTADIAEDILTKHGVTPLAHLTCVSSDKKTVENTLSSLKGKKIENCNIKCRICSGRIWGPPCGNQVFREDIRKLILIFDQSADKNSV